MEHIQLALTIISVVALLIAVVALIVPFARQQRTVQQVSQNTNEDILAKNNGDTEISSTKNIVFKTPRRLASPDKAASESLLEVGRFNHAGMLSINNTKPTGWAHVTGDGDTPQLRIDLNSDVFAEIDVDLEGRTNITTSGGVLTFDGNVVETSRFSYLGRQDQAVSQTSLPTFAGMRLRGSGTMAEFQPTAEGGVNIQMDGPLLINGASIGTSAITTTNVPEGTNLYHTDSRVRAAVSSGNSLISYNHVTGQISGNVTPTFTSITISGFNGVLSASAGVVSAAALTTSSVSEASNLYYTDARARAAISSGNSLISYNSTTGQISGNTAPTFTALTLTGFNGILSASAGVVTAAALSTSDVAEGSNLYYTDARARSAMSSGNSLISYNSTTGQISGNTAPTFTALTITGFSGILSASAGVVTAAALSTSDVAEGSNLYYTDARARSAMSSGNSLISYNSTTGQISGNTAPTFTALTITGFSGILSASAGVVTASALSTSDVAEGSNLYHTDARARAAISSGNSLISYNSTTGQISGNTSPTLTALTITGLDGILSASAGVITAAALNTSSVSEGSNLYYTDTRARAAISSGNSLISYNSSTGQISGNASPTLTGLTITTYEGVLKATTGSVSASAIIDADISASAGIVDSKLATISTAGKVSNSATTATSSNTVSAIVQRDSSGNFSAGTITAVALRAQTGGIICANGDLATNATSGFLYVPSCPGVPSGAPTAETGTTPLVYDSAGKTVYVYDGSAWTAVAGGAPGASFTKTFEYYNNNLDNFPFSMTYDGSGRLITVTYTTGSGSIVKTLNYDGSGNLSTIAISGVAGLTFTTKTLSYSSGIPTGASYS